MSRNTSISIGQHLTSFIDSQVHGGRYCSASSASDAVDAVDVVDVVDVVDAVKTGLRLREEYEAKVKALQDALLAGLHSGEPRPFDFEAFKTRKRAGHAASPLA